MRSLLPLLLLSLACGSAASTTDGGETPDAGVSAGSVTCGPATCALATEVCCVALSAGPVCGASCASGAHPQRCDGPEDCGGDLCCGAITTGFECKASASCGTTSRLCHGKADCRAGECCGPLTVGATSLSVCTAAPGC